MTIIIIIKGEVEKETITTEAEAGLLTNITVEEDLEAQAIIGSILTLLKGIIIIIDVDLPHQAIETQ